MSTNITEEHKRTFSALVSGDYENFALVSTTFDGEPTAVVAAVGRIEDEYIVVPLLVFVTDAMVERLTDPGSGL